METETQTETQTETSVQTAKRLKSEGYSYRSIGKMLGIGKTTARDWVSGMVKAPKTATISLEIPIPIPFIKTSEEVKEESEDLKEFILNLSPIHYNAPKRPVVYQEANKIALIIGDTHFGCEHQPTLDLFLKTVEELKPEKVIINGDSCDLFAVSKYPKDVRHTYSLFQEREAYHRFLKILHDITAPYNSEIIETNSNHSGENTQSRWWRYLSDRIGEISDLPEVIEALSYENVFFPKFEGCRMSLVDYVELVPEFIIMHGDMVRKKGGMSGIGMMEKYNTSIIMNHCHRTGSSIRRLPSIGSKPDKFLRVYENGCAADISKCTYTSAADWSNGFSIVNYSNIDNIAVEQCLVQNNSVSICALGKTLKV